MHHRYMSQYKLPIFSKLLERLVYDRIVNFNDHFSILHKITNLDFENQDQPQWL